MSLGLLGGVLFDLEDCFITILSSGSQRPTYRDRQPLATCVETSSTTPTAPTLGPLFIWVCGFTIQSSHYYPINYYPILSNIIPILSQYYPLFSNIIQYYELLPNIIPLLSHLVALLRSAIGRARGQRALLTGEETVLLDLRETRPVVGNEDLGRSMGFQWKIIEDIAYGLNDIIH